jgi:hypothetical protein
MREKTIALLFVLLLSSCVKEADWPLQDVPVTQLFIDGILTDQAGKQTIRITFAVKNLNDTVIPVIGANALISNEDSTFQLAEEPAGNGQYSTEPNFVAVPGKNYTLLVFYQGKVYSGKTPMEPGQFFDAFLYSRDDDNGLYHVDWVASAFATEDPAMWEILLDWSEVPGYTGMDSTKTRVRMLFYTLPTLDVSQVFAPRVEQIYFPAGTIVTERRYSLTASYAEYIREVLLETSWQGGLFSSAPATVTTNMSAGAAGFFAACGMTSVSFTIAP